MFYTTFTYMSNSTRDVDTVDPDFIGQHIDGRQFRFLFDGDKPSVIKTTDRFFVDLQWVDTEVCFILELPFDQHDLAYSFGFILPQGRHKNLRCTASTITHDKQLVCADDRCVDKNGTKWIILKQHRNRCVIVNTDYTDTKIITPENVTELFNSGSLIWCEEKQWFMVSDVDTFDAHEYNIPDEIKQLSACKIFGNLRADGKLYIETKCMYDEDYNEVKVPCDMVLHGNMLDYIKTTRHWL